MAAKKAADQDDNKPVTPEQTTSGTPEVSGETKEPPIFRLARALALVASSPEESMQGIPHLLNELMPMSSLGGEAFLKQVFRLMQSAEQAHRMAQELFFLSRNK